MKNRSPYSGRGLPKLTGKEIQRLDRYRTDDDVIYDTIEVANTLTHIMIGALIEPGRDGERWVRRQIRDLLAARELKRYRTYEILTTAQQKPSAFDWLVYYLQKLELTKAPNGGHLHAGRIVDVDYEMEVVPNV